MAKKDTPPVDAGTEATTAAASVDEPNSALRVVGDFGPELIYADAFAHVGDAYWGQGGRYIVGADGKRVPAPVITEGENHG